MKAWRSYTASQAHDKMVANSSMAISQINMGYEAIAGRYASESAHFALLLLDRDVPRRHIVSAMESDDVVSSNMSDHFSIESKRLKRPVSDEFAASLWDWSVHTLYSEGAAVMRRCGYIPYEGFPLKRDLRFKVA